MQREKVLGVFSLAMLTIGSVDSIRNLPSTAMFGATAIFFFAFAALAFLLPAGLVSAEMASAWPEQGGVYLWVKKAFGSTMGFMAIWFQWVENLIWYPTILSFISGALAYLIDPSLIHNRIYLVSCILIVFWGVTFLNVMGVKASAWFSGLCSIAGLIVPMFLIVAMASIWIIGGHHVNIQFGAHGFVQSASKPQLMVSLTSIILCFCGIEIATSHAHEVKNPQRDFPRALVFSICFIFITMLLGSLSIAVVTPHGSISLVAGVIQAFSLYFIAYHVSFLTPIVACLLMVGIIGGISNWVLGPTKCLAVALREVDFPVASLYSLNENGAPATLLWAQAVIVSFISMTYLLMSTINASYWILTVIALQVYMLMYILMFAAGIYLRYKCRHIQRAYKVPFGNLGMWVVGLVGILTCLLAIGTSFFQPSGFTVEQTDRYIFTLGSIIFVISTIPFLVCMYTRKKTLSGKGFVNCLPLKSRVPNTTTRIL